LDDLRISLRMLLKRPGFLIAAALVLALGIGATSAIYSFIHAFVLHPLDLPGAGRIMQVWETDQREGWAKREVAPGNFLDWQRQNQAFERLAAYRPASFNLASRGEPERLSGATVSADFFRVLGVKPILGRDFLPREDTAGAARVAVISSDLWRRHFAADPKVVGGSYVVDGKSCTVVGVLPAGFHLPHLGRADIWVPFSFAAGDANNRTERWLYVLGRLKPGVSLEKVQAEMTVIAERLAVQHPRTDTRIGALVVPLEQEVAQLYRPSFLILLVASACLLLLACANVANLQLAHTSTREQEILIRVSLGVGRRRLIRQLFMESLLIALFGAGLALIVARFSIALMLLKLPAEILGYVPHYGKVPIDWSVLLFTLGTAVVTAVLFGLSPAVRASRPQINTLLKGAGRASAGRGAHLRRALLMVSEVTLALTLLITAALMLESFGRLQQVDPGFKARRVLTTQLDLPESVYATPAQITQFYDNALARIASVPGVVSAAVIDHVPMGGSNYSGSVGVEGSAETGEWSFAMMRSASSDYFRTLGIPLLEGRSFSVQDTAAAHPVVIVNQVMAKHFWPSGSALGKRLKRDGLDSGNPWLEVVGVAGDVKHWGLADGPSPQIYQPIAQWPQRSGTLVIRTASERSTSVAQAVRKAVLAVDPHQPLAEFRTLTRLVDNSMLLQSMSIVLLGFFGTIALLIGAAGVFSVIYYLTLQRTHEFGIRMALGASPGNIVQLVLKQGIRLVGVGLLIGVALAFGVARAMAGLLYGIGPGDLSAYASAALLLGAIAALAIYLPARQVSRVAPSVSTRYR
jgi:putative ABC transport system permease protein